MDSLRLPPLRFATRKCSNELNCVLPPVTPPPRLSPTNNTPWYNSSTLPTPPPISPSTDIANLAIATADDPKFSPVTQTPPSTIAALPPAPVFQSPVNRTAQPNLPPPSQYPLPTTFTNPQQSYPLQTSLPEQTHLPHQRYPQSSLPSTPPVPWAYAPSAASPQITSNPAQRPPEPFTGITTAPLQSQLSTAPHPAVISLSAQQLPDPLNGDPHTYADGSPYPTITSQDATYLAPTSASAGASSSQQPPVVKSPVKKTVSTARGVRDVYACPYPNCARVSTEQSNMKAHMRMHTGEKPYVCRTAGCMKAFRWKSSLTYHEKALHVKARPFKCSPCRRSFVEKRKLRMHFDLCPVIRRHREQGGEGDGGSAIP